MKNFKLMLILTGLITASVASSAASHAGAPMAKDDAKKTMPTAAAVDMVEGEVRKVDKENKKITLKHGGDQKSGYAGHDHGLRHKRCCHAGQSQSG